MFSEIWSLSEYYDEEIKRRNSLRHTINIESETPIKRIKLSEIDSHKQIQGKCKFSKRLYGNNGWSPKLALFQYCDKMKWHAPKLSLVNNFYLLYHYYLNFKEQDDNSKLFYCSLLLNDILYINEIGFGSLLFL